VSAIRYHDRHVLVHCIGRKVRGFKTLAGAMRSAERIATSGAMVMVFPGHKSPILHATVRPGVTEVLFRSDVEDET
jgi:hypothetical protein